MINQEENNAEPSSKTSPSPDEEQNASPEMEESALPTAEEVVKHLQSEIAEKDQAVKEAHERTLRALADLENYKKRIQKEQIEQTKFANERLIREILPVIDNLERALSHSRETKDPEKIIEGVELIHKGLLSALEKFNARPIESLNKPFDPFQHQSVGQVDAEANSEIEDNQVVVENQKGYFLNERVLRPALVLVSKKKAATADKEETPEDQCD
ncbi:MAG: nucleotide exchange factor GrpE [Nitrospiria bacterium]